MKMEGKSYAPKKLNANQGMASIWQLTEQISQPF